MVHNPLGDTSFVDPISDPGLRTRIAGPRQAILLLLSSCLPVLGIVLIAPVQPRILQAFADTPAVDFLVPMIVTAPALAIAVISPFAGALADKFGRKRLLVLSMLLYGIFGTAPLWLTSIEIIVLSRVGLGVAEAIVITVSTTLIADYFRAAERHKYLGYQVVVTTIAGTVFLAVGGILGNLDWRAPFWLYAVSLVLGLAMMIVLWEPEHSQDTGRVPVPWKTIGTPALVTLFGGMVFYVLIVYLPFLLSGHGISDPGTIGLAAAGTSLATAAGAYTFRFIAKKGTGVLLMVAFGVAGLGQIIVWLSGAGPVLIFGAVVGSFGTGVLVPALLTWAVSKIDPVRLGVGTGMWQSALFLGQFLTPIVVVGVVPLLGGLPQAVGSLGIAALAAATASIILAKSRGRSYASEAHNP
jgi:MFS family permease